MRIFFAGASGAIGRRLTPLLLTAGHEVTGSTRSPETARQLNAAGIHGVVADVFDAGALRDAVVNARPEIAPRRRGRGAACRILSAQSANPNRSHAI